MLEGGVAPGIPASKHSPKHSHKLNPDVALALILALIPTLVLTVALTLDLTHPLGKRHPRTWSLKVLHMSTTLPHIDQHHTRLNSSKGGGGGVRMVYGGM